MTGYCVLTVRKFLEIPETELLGLLTKKASQDIFRSIEASQARSWSDEIKILKNCLKSIPNIDADASILLEYSIPRRGKRIDAVILAQDIIFVLEFKNRIIENNTSYQRHEIEQCEDYALDLRDFHKESKNKVIIPVLIDTAARHVLHFDEIDNLVKAVRGVNNADSLRDTIVAANAQYGTINTLNVARWDASVYEPTPTIIEAAQRLYANHTVSDITSSGADRYNLGKTTDAVLHAIDFAMQKKKKVIIFVTGVPGSGKTLVGLNIAHNESIRSKGYNAAFLSGNYPLVEVLQHALAKDRAKREEKSLRETLRDAQTKVQHMLRFKAHYHLSTGVAPDEHIIIFDEAQRAWNKEQMVKKSNTAANPYTTSEPELIMEIMNRHAGWAVVIGLIGTGQEIHNGEAGLREWGKTIKSIHADWVVFTSPEGISSERLYENQTLFDAIPPGIEIHKDPDLHLRTTIRSYKAATLSDWVNAVLSNNPTAAKEIISHITEYPIVITRDLQKAKKWIKLQCRGTRSSGLVCSSGGKRLRPVGIESEIELDVVKWFLSAKTDVRSSSFLELPATEFDIQGLERDWICLAWDQDLTRNEHGWIYRDFVGSKWKYVVNDLKKEYLVNTYRVLMTRGREGFVIFVPRGDPEDTTRPPEFYDNIYLYLCKAGAVELV